MKQNKFVQKLLKLISLSLVILCVGIALGCFLSDYFRPSKVGTYWTYSEVDFAVLEIDTSNFQSCSSIAISEDFCEWVHNKKLFRDPNLGEIKFKPNENKALFVVDTNLDNSNSNQYFKKNSYPSKDGWAEKKIYAKDRYYGTYQISFFGNSNSSPFNPPPQITLLVHMNHKIKLKLEGTPESYTFSVERGKLN